MRLWEKELLLELGWTWFYTVIILTFLCVVYLLFFT